MPNIHELDRPLKMGDQKQIAVVQALELGKRPCRKCGNIMDLDERDDGFCPGCYVARAGAEKE